MTLLFHGLWMLCAFATAVFAAAAICGWWSAAFALAGFALSATATGPAYLPDSTWLGVLAALVATLGLAWPRHWILTSLAAGAFAGIWASLFETQQLPMGPALVASAVVPALAAWLTMTRPRFAPPILRDEGLLAVFVLGVAVAIAPGVQEGWRSALALNLDSTSAGQAVPAWTMFLAGASVLGGGMYSLWSRR
jgi:hypothetical protein